MTRLDTDLTSTGPPFGYGDSIFLILVSQKTSFLYSPTVMAMTRAQWGVRLKMFLLGFQSQKEMTQLLQLVPRKEVTQ
jgi:hypothetical protein